MSLNLSQVIIRYKILLFLLQFNQVKTDLVQYICHARALHLSCFLVDHFISNLQKQSQESTISKNVRNTKMECTRNVSKDWIMIYWINPQANYVTAWWSSTSII